MRESTNSIEPTYDSRETGPRYHVSTVIDGHVVSFREPIDDPFVCHQVHLGWRDLLRGLLRRRLTVAVHIGGDREIMDDVLELDANQLVPGRTRRQRFGHESLKAFGEELDRGPS